MTKENFKDLTFPALYTAFWLSIHFLILGLSFPVYSLSVSLVYGVGHYLALTKHNHIGTSADSLAFPLAIGTVIISVIIANVFPMMPVDYDAFIKSTTHLVSAFLVSFIGAHIFVLLVVFIYDALFDNN